MATVVYLLPYSDKFSMTKIFADRSMVYFLEIIFEDRGQGGATPILFNHTSAQELLSIVSDGCSHSVLCCTLSYLHLKFGRNFCVGASFPAKIVVCSSILSTPLTSAFADAMEDDGTAVDRGPACPCREKSHDPLMETLHEPVTCVKLSRV